MKQRLPVNLSTSRWLAYAVAGAASGLISMPWAEGAIHYSGLLNKRFNGDGDKAFPLAPGASIIFEHSPPYTYSEGSTSIFFPGGAGVAMLGGSIAGFTRTCIYTNFIATASNLDAGAPIAQQPFTEKPGILVDLSQTWVWCSSFRGDFIKDPSGYIGFRFDVGEGMQYGWARLRVRNAYEATYELLDYGYADPGERIRAGQRKERETSGVTEESLGALALGAAGVAAWRKRRERRVA
jgi:hypothetical protein